jgi:hypothetical protein
MLKLFSLHVAGLNFLVEKWFCSKDKSRTIKIIVLNCYLFKRAIIQEKKLPSFASKLGFSNTLAFMCQFFDKTNVKFFETNKQWY